MSSYLPISVDTFGGESLHLVKLDRKQMGAYLCIASNEVPPAVSKRITLNINCKYYLVLNYMHESSRVSKRHVLYLIIVLCMNYFNFNTIQSWE